MYGHLDHILFFKDRIGDSLAVSTE